jgi:hypothetical protein
MWIPNPLNGRMRREVSNAGAYRSDAIKVKPGLGYYLREITTSMRRSARWIYVSDGGHLENLGLVELLRRRCTDIWCVDSSGDRPGSATTLARAMLMASGELGVEINLDLNAFALDEDASVGRRYRTRSSFATGEIFYPDGLTGTLTVLKLGLGPNCPSQLVTFQRSRPKFPYDSTANQIYTAELFDAYMQLGRASCLEALHARGASNSQGMCNIA